MFDQLNPRTREIVISLCGDDTAELGGNRIQQFTEDERMLLGVLASHLPQLADTKGHDLVKEAVGLLDGGRVEEAITKTQGDTQFSDGQGDGSPCCQYRLGMLRACSFRGLAPAGQIWEFDFAGRSHLMYGPNGCGKSSLLGAVSYCLTGHIFRDDQPPEAPRIEKAYRIEGKRSRVSERPDALALIDQAGKNTAPDDEYWVQAQLLGRNAREERKEIWVRRHSKHGLTASPDGEIGSPVQTLRELGIAELDAELNLIMPARLAHIRFGKDQVLSEVLAQVIGLNDLEAIADLATRLVTALRREITRTRKEELAREEDRVAEACRLVKEMDSDLIRGLSSYADALGDKRTLTDVQTFGEAIKEAIAKNNAQLATDLGVAIPAKDSEGFAQFEKDLENLPGQVQTTVDELAKPLAQLFSSSLGFRKPTENECAKLEGMLQEFAMRAQQQVKERLDWVREERADPKVPLMLLAAKYFPEGGSICPVCDQDLAGVPSVRAKLEELRPLTQHPHLALELEDVESRLLRDLDGIVSPQQRREGGTGLSERIVSDWQTFRRTVSKGLLEQVVAGFDISVHAMSQQFVTDDVGPIPSLAGDYAEGFPHAFHRLDEAIADAKAYVQLCKSMIQRESNLKNALERVLIAEQGGAPDDSLKIVLERGRMARDAIGRLTEALRFARDLYKGAEKRQELLDRIAKYERWANAGNRVKSLGEGVRNEVTRMVQKLETEMKARYSQLYGDETLELDMLTTGHAGNADVKGEINAYLLAGQERVPIGPFSNAGRFRALVLSFVFALLNESQKSLGVVVLDDPAVSLDDEHKAKLVNRVIRPTLDTRQVLLATHYEAFQELAERAFAGEKSLCMVPRRQVSDEVAFWPGDILERVEDSVSQNQTNWRDQAGSLRRWIERSLQALSAYCPEPFWKYNDLIATVASYASLDDVRVATPGRDTICQILSRDFIGDVHRLAHNENATYDEFKANLTTLKGCNKHVNKELRRFRDIYEQELAALKLASAPTVQVLALPNRTCGWNLQIVREAAAAHNGQGIEWDENDLRLMEGHQVVLAMRDSLGPIVLRGQRVLLDNQDRLPRDRDLVAVETADESRYLRRFWKSPHGSLLLEAVHPTEPMLPVQLSSGIQKMRRVVGVLFERVNPRHDTKAIEWAPTTLKDGWFGDIVGLRIIGTSMEPVIREGQIVLVRRNEDGEAQRGDLACIDVRDGGTVIKRCYPSKDEWVLCSVNPTDLEDPMRVRSEDILHAYPLAGVIFELDIQ